MSLLREKGCIEGVEGPDLSVKWKKGLARAHKPALHFPQTRGTNRAQGEK